MIDPPARGLPCAQYESATATDWQDADVGRKIKLRDELVRQLDAMPDRPADQSAILLPTSVPGFEHGGVVVLAGVDFLARGPTSLQVGGKATPQPPALAFVVESRDDLMTALVAARVIGIVQHDVSLDTVVVRINPRHKGSMNHPAAQDVRQ